MRWLALILLVGCGDNLPGIAAADHQGAETAAKCQQLSRCGLFAAEESCIALIRPSNDATLLAAVESGLIKYDAISEAMCLQGLADVPCDRTLRSFRVPPISCEGAFLGTLAAGSACAFDDECSTGRCALPTCPPTTCCMGTCKPVKKTLGGDCERNDDCLDATYCSADHKCVQLVKSGGACPNDAVCDYGLGCVGASSIEPGMCRKLPAIGEACPYNRCGDIGARCDSGKCVAFSLPGAACSTDAECSPYARCDTASRLCADMPSLGQPCTDRCAGEAFCQGGVCIALLPNGEPCSADSECESDLCAEGPIFDVCVAKQICL